MQKPGLLAPVTSVWDKYKDEYSKGIRDAFTIDGQLYALPWSIEYWLVYYNKDVYSQLGLSVPKNWDEFLANCQKIKAAGKTPLNQTIVDEWPAFIVFEEIAASVDPNLYNDLCTGKKKFTDPQAVEIFRVWKDMIDKVLDLPACKLVLKPVQILPLPSPTSLRCTASTSASRSMPDPRNS